MRILTAAALILLAGTLADAHARQSRKPQGRSRTPVSVAQFNGVTFSDLPASEKPGRYQFLVVQASDIGAIRRLERANPGVKILLYQDPFLARPTDPDGISVCSDWPSLDQQDPGWLLHDQNGDLIADAQLSGNDLMDVGDVAYQRACVGHAIALAKRIGADGVFLDDTNASLAPYLSQGVSVPAYPSNATWRSAETAFLTTATAQLHAAHLISVTNIGGAVEIPGLWERWSRIVDGSMEQAFNDWAGGTAALVAQWRRLLLEPVWSQGHAKYTLLQASDNGERENTFGLASMLLVANGMTSYSTSNVNFDSDEQWYGTYTAARRLGVPLARATRLANGLYERRFSNGLVVVNPTSRGPISLRLHRTLTDAATKHRESLLHAAPVTGYVLEDQSASG